MEAIKVHLQSVINREINTSPTEKNPKPDMKNLNGSFRTINALDCIGSNISPDDIMKAEELIKLNYGIDYLDAKFTMLWKLVSEEGWTNERLMRTVKWVLKTKKYPNWTIADFFEYEIELHPYSWYLEQIHKGVKHEDMTAYRVKGKVYWKMDDGTELPLEKA